MTLAVLADRAGMNTTTVGTGGTLALGAALGAVPPNLCSFQDFPTAGITNGQIVSYVIFDTNTNWEVGRGTYSSTGPSLTGRTVLSSSNADAAISLTGNAQIFISALAEDIMTNWQTGAGLKGGTIQNGGSATLDPGYMRSYLAGMQLSNDATLPNTSIDISAGVCVDSTNGYFIQLPAIVKGVSGLWGAGSGNVAMGNGLTITASTWYHVFAIINAGAADIYFDTSVTAANKPAGTTAFRRIGSFLTDASAHIFPFSQYGDEFLWLAAVNDINTATLGTSPTLFTLSVPPGVKVHARIRGSADNAAAGISVSISSPDETAAGPMIARSASNVNAGSAWGVAFDVTNRTNTSGQIQLSASAPSTSVSAYTAGWIDRRGRDN
jgi:hypothetical protein